MQAIQIGQPTLPPSNLADLGFEVLRRLAARRIAPTPDAYRAVYDEIAGVASEQAEAVLARFGTDRAHAPYDQRHAQSRIRALESRLQRLSELVGEDQLTGCLNRRGLDDVFARELNRAARRGTPLCVAMLDLDDFKQINDRHGHCVGDRVLAHLARVIRQTLRSMDVVARFGGEEFLVLLPDTTLEAADLALARLQQQLAEQPFTHQRRRLPITFSAGLAIAAADEGRQALVARADAALYLAKRTGKNRVVRAA